jgi:hypothetical protein
LITNCWFEFDQIPFLLDTFHTESEALPVIMPQNPESLVLIAFTIIIAFLALLCYLQGLRPLLQ